MSGARVTITTEEHADFVRFVCILTEDQEIDGGLKPYLERYGVEVSSYEADIVGSQVLIFVLPSIQTLERIQNLIEAYYLSWGKEPNIRPIGDIIR